MYISHHWPWVTNMPHTLSNLLVTTIVFILRHYGISNCMASNDRMINKQWIGKDVEGSGRGINLRYCPNICLKELRTATKNLSQDSRGPAWDSNQEPPKYQTQVSLFELTCSLYHYWNNYYGTAGKSIKNELLQCENRTPVLQKVKVKLSLCLIS
jgi:hypothetical protein